MNRNSIVWSWWYGVEALMVWPNCYLKWFRWIRCHLELHSFASFVLFTLKGKCTPNQNNQIVWETQKWCQNDGRQAVFDLLIRSFIKVFSQLLFCETLFFSYSKHLMECVIQMLWTGECDPSLATLTQCQGLFWQKKRTHY